MEISQSDTKTNHKILDSDDILNCPICLESFEDITDEIITCGCGNKVCLSCAKQSLLNTDKDPHCFNCKRGWDRAFQYDNFGNRWINNNYKKYRKTLLLEREKARMPETQPKVETYMKLIDYREELKKLIAIENNIKEALSKAKMNTNELRTKIFNIEKGNYEEVEKKKFVMKCPNDGCRGFLSTAYKCDLCKVFVCPQCHEVKGHTKDAEHTCDSNTVETIKQLKKDTKPCPACSTPIFKISGCDQMWCTQCKVAFSWRKGTIEKGVVHNPHYYQWMKDNQTNVQNPGAEVCGGIPRYYDMHRTMNIITPMLKNSSNKHIVISKTGTTSHSITLQELFIQYVKTFNVCNNEIIYNGEYQYRRIFMMIHRSAQHNSYTIIESLREAVNGAINNEDLRIRYLANEIDDKHLAKMITQRDNIREKKLAMLQILELFNNVITDFLRGIVNYQHGFAFEDIQTIHDNLMYLYKTIVYCNIELMKVSKNYKMKVYYIDPSCIVETQMLSYEQICLAIQKDKLVAQECELPLESSYKDL